MHAQAVVGEHPHRRCGRGHGAQVSEPLTAQAGGDRADRMHIDEPDITAAPVHVLDDHRGVGHRIGVGHSEHRGVATQRRGGRAGGDRLGVLPTGFAQVRVQVDQAGQRNQAPAVEVLGAGSVQLGAQLSDHSPADQQVDRVARAIGPDPTQQQGSGHACSSWAASRW